MKKLIVYLLCGVISAVAVGKLIINHTPILPDVKKSCKICYECAAYLNGDVFYLDRLYSSINNAHIISNVQDAQERFERVLEYNDGQFNYSRIVCKCSTVQAKAYSDHLQEVQKKSDIRYERYLRHKQILLTNKNIKNEQAEKGPGI